MEWLSRTAGLLTLSALILGLATAVRSALPARPAGGAVSIFGLHVTGNQILNGAGTPVYIHGVGPGRVPSTSA